MSKFGSTLFSMSRRAYSVAAESTKVGSTAAATVRKVAAEGGDGKANWMRDPKTGNWMPENQFGEVDAAELRAQLLSKNKPITITSSSLSN